MWNSFAQLVSACIGIIGSIFFAIGVMRQSVEAALERRRVQT